MGTNCGPYLANRFLHRYEKEFTSYILIVNPNIAYSLKHIFRFQDDLIVFEDDDVLLLFLVIYIQQKWCLKILTYPQMKLTILT